MDITKNISKATEVAFVFDTTGSMQPCIANVRNHITKTCEELFQDIPNLKIGFIAHGDYCDGNRCYDILKMTDDKAAVFKFIQNTPNTHGGDQPECYELALNLAKTLGWSDKKGGKVVVMIGDAEPHEVDYPGNKDKLDWKKELAELKEMGINVYPLQCLYSAYQTRANDFWSSIAEVMGTPLLKLDNFQEANMAVKAFAYASAGSGTFDKFEKKLKMCGMAMTDSMVARNAVLRSESLKYDTMEVLDTPSAEPKVSAPPVKKTSKSRVRKKK